MKNALLEKILYKSLVVFLCFCWIIFALFTLYRFYEIKYAYPLKYKQTIITYADYYEIDRALIFAVIKTESNFDEKANSKVGAKGLMQITESTADYIAERLCLSEYDIFDAETNVMFGCYYIRYLINRFVDLDTALMAYNAGEGKVKKWLTDKKYSEDGKRLNITPYQETNEYILKIHKNFEKYNKLYKKILDK